MNYRFLKYFFGSTFCLYVVLCFFNHPSYDDFTYTVSTFGKTFLQSQLFWYTNWSGRYTATALLTINPLVYHWIYGYKMLSLAIVLGLFFTINFLVKTFFDYLKPSEQWFLTFFLASFYFSLLPHLAGGIYWMAGSVTHAVPTILVGLSIALLKRKGKNVLLDYVFLPLLTFFIVGCNETIMFIWMTLLFLTNVYILFKQKKIDAVLALLFIIGIVGTFIVISAPGNIGRSKVDGTAPRPLHNVIDASAYAFVYMIKFGSIPFGFFLIWLMKNAKNIQDKMRWYWIDKHSLTLTFFVFWVIQFCTFFPALWAMDRQPPKYVYNMSILFYLPLSILTVMQFTILYPEKCKFINYFNLNNTKVVIIFCSLFVLYGNTGRAIKDVFWKAPRYNAQMIERYSKMEKSLGQDVEVEELLYKPRSIFYSDIESDPISDKNKRYAEYFHLRTIKKVPVKLSQQ